MAIGSKFVISGSGDEDIFNVVVGVNANGSHEGVWRHHEVVPGPKKRTIAANDRCVFNVLVLIFREAAAALAPGGRLLLAEPSGHVSDATFAKELDYAARAGLAVKQRPVVKRFQAALLAKETA